MSIRKMERHERRTRRQLQGQLAQVNDLIAHLEDREAMGQIKTSGTMTAAKWSAVALLAFLGVLVAFACLPRFVVYFHAYPVFTHG